MSCAAPGEDACVEVLRPGPFATVQDLGRPGYADLGVTASGAADQRSLRLANRLVGNPEGHAGVELTFGGLAARFSRAGLIALTGAPCPLRVGARAADMYAPIPVRAGDELHVGAPSHGLRTYLAVRGGIAVPATLGSRATDTLSALGPEPLRAGAVLPVGAAVLRHPGVDLAPQAPYPEEPELRLVPGPREDWFLPETLDALCSASFEVSPESNRIGLRLVGPPLRRRHSGELPPEGTVAGALQVPASAQPILFLADHPVTGGYPVIAVVHGEDLHLAAQARPGQRVRFRLAAG